MCAAGPFLKDECAEKCEKQSWSALRHGGLVPDTNASLIIDLQMVHDTLFPSDWSYRLEVLAERYNLEYKF